MRSPAAVAAAECRQPNVFIYIQTPSLDMNLNVGLVASSLQNSQREFDSGIEQFVFHWNGYDIAWARLNCRLALQLSDSQMR